MLATAGLGWRHAFGDVAPQSSMRFASGNPYTVTGAPLARNAMVAELGISAAVGQRARLSVSYAGQIAGSTRDHGVQARASWSF
jgi:subtilase-type serine protease